MYWFVTVTVYLRFRSNESWCHHFEKPRADSSEHGRRNDVDSELVWHGDDLRWWGWTPGLECQKRQSQHFASTHDHGLEPDERHDGPSVLDVQQGDDKEPFGEATSAPRPEQHKATQAIQHYLCLPQE